MKIKEEIFCSCQPFLIFNFKKKTDIYLLFFVVYIGGGEGDLLPLQRLQSTS